RSDLFHRLNVVAIELPPLRERGDDSIALAEAFIASICGEYGMAIRALSSDGREWIKSYAWPGNVRELRNRIERILLLENDVVVRAAHFGANPAPVAAVVVESNAGHLQVSLPT